MLRIPAHLAVVLACAVTCALGVAPDDARVGPGWTSPLGPAIPAAVHSFDPPAHPWSVGHRGVDLPGAPGQEVGSAGDGTVMFAGMLAGRGVVVVGHGALRTTYEPVSAQVIRGQRVTAGQIIGTLALLGTHCAPQACLHWGVLRGETYLDPLALLRRGPSRLVPVWPR